MTDINPTSLKKKKILLESRFLNGEITHYSKALAMLLDDYLFSSYEKSMTGLQIGIVNNPYAVVALGSYGRSEPAMHSELALLVLFEKTVPDETEDLVKEIIYPLWDAGFEVAHVTRTLSDCIDTAGDDIEVLLSLMDGRFVCGMSRLFFSLYESLQKKIIRTRASKIMSMIVEKNRGRHERFGDSSYLLEPNLKDGQGGLGDYYAMLSIAKIKSDLRLPRDLEYSGYLSEKEYEELEEAVTFVLNTRNLLHSVTGRKSDQLYMEHQRRIAELMEYKNTNPQEAVELFLSDLHGRIEIIKHQYKLFLLELGFTGRESNETRILPKKTRVKGLEVTKKNTLTFSSIEAVIQSPMLLVKIFGESTSLKIPLSAEAKRIVRDLSGELIDDAFRKSRSVLRAFEKVLLTPALEFNVLEEMLRSGFLCEFIPEFTGIVNRIQYNDYHIYPVDKHSLKTVQAAKIFALPENEDPALSTIYSGLHDKKLLLWACLLHDIGKNELSGKHSETGADMAEVILHRFAYADDQIDTISFLIRDHLLLVKTATRRDINDEETAVFCARQIRDPERLQMLYLLTLADSMATGPKAWNDWTSSLIKSLYQKTLNILNKGEFTPSEAVDSVEAKKLALTKMFNGFTFDRGTLETYLTPLSLRYLLNIPEKEIHKHILLYTRLKNREFVFDVGHDPVSDTRVVTICAKNRAGLFSKIAGVLTLSGFNILDAQIHTWKNGTALDIFHISPPRDRLFEEEKWKDVSRDLESALLHDLNLSVRIDSMVKNAPQVAPVMFHRPTKIEIDNETSGYFTIIEVHTSDFPGLLFTITDTLFKCGLEIFVAKIGTSADQVVDTFYVRNFYGEKVSTDKQIHHITSELERVLD